jgi:uncharacterized OB-fold protein
VPFRPPDPDHPLFGPFWRDAPDGVLWMPRCRACSVLMWPPAEVCPECLASGFDWVEAPGGGVVWGAAEYHRGYSAGLSAEVPYQCVLVELDCGPRLVARHIGASAAMPGDRVDVVRQRSAGYALPCFTSAPSDAGGSSE